MSSNRMEALRSYLLGEDPNAMAKKAPPPIRIAEIDRSFYGNAEKPGIAHHVLRAYLPSFVNLQKPLETTAKSPLPSVATQLPASRGALPKSPSENSVIAKLPQIQ